MPKISPNSRDFSARIDWYGPEDKPFYRALLVSRSRQSMIVDRPFWNHAVIGMEEFGRLVETLRRDHPFAAGPYRPNGPEYFVEIEAGRETCHCSLGFDHQTITALSQMAAALDPDHRQPIEAIVSRLGRL